MPAERSGPAVCNSSDRMGGKGELINAPDYLQDQNRKICAVAKAEAAERGGVGRRFLFCGKPARSERSYKPRPEANR